MPSKRAVFPPGASTWGSRAQAPPLLLCDFCCCFMLGSSQGHSGHISSHGAGSGFWVLRSHLFAPPFILAAPMGSCPYSAPAVAGLAVAVRQGTTGTGVQQRRGHTMGDWEQEPRTEGWGLGQGNRGLLSCRPGR